MSEPKRIILGVCSQCEAIYDISGQPVGEDYMLPCGHKLGHMVRGGGFIRDALNLQYRLPDVTLCQDCAEALGLVTDAE